MAATSQAVGVHWQVAQATSLVNLVVNMSTASGNNHIGIAMENGSGGVMTDLVLNGVSQLNSTDMLFCLLITMTSFRACMVSASVTSNLLFETSP